MALQGVAMETPAGYGMEMGERRECSAECKAKVQEPQQVSLLSRLPGFVDLSAQFRTLCQKQGVGALQGWRKGQMSSLLISLPPPRSLSVFGFFSWKSAPSPLDPSPSLGPWCSVQPEQGSLLVHCLGSVGCPEPRAAIPQRGLCSQPSASRVFGGRINTSYHSDRTGGIFLILSVHIFHSWPQKQCSAPPPGSLTQDFSSPQDSALPRELWLQLCHKSFGSKHSLCRDRQV